MARQVTNFVDPLNYEDRLCRSCQRTLELVTAEFEAGNMPDTDDPEAPMMYAWDHGLLHQPDCFDYFD